MNKEKILEQQFGKKRPFKVPEGYFDDFSARIMDSLPQKEAKVVIMHPNILYRFRSAILASACVCAALFGGVVFFHSHNNSIEETSAQAKIHSKSAAYSDIDVAADYVMIDNEDIYAYVSGEH